MTRPQQTMQNNSQRKKINLLFRKLKTPKILQLAYSQSVSSDKKNMDQMSAGSYKQNVITTMLLSILPSFIRKSHLSGLAHRKSLLFVFEASLLMSINHYTHHRHLALSQTNIMSHLLKKSLLILEPQVIFLPIVHIFVLTKNIIMSFKPVLGKY